MLERRSLDHLVTPAAQHVRVRREVFFARAHQEDDRRDIRTAHRGDSVGGFVAIVNDKIEEFLTTNQYPFRRLLCLSGGRQVASRVMNIRERLCKREKHSVDRP